MSCWTWRRAACLSHADVLDRQVKRMLADPRSETLMQNFGGQWLLVRNLDDRQAGRNLLARFDETLRQSMQRETELFLDSVMRENRGVMELLTADYTFLNERLAQHYGIPNVQGSRLPPRHAAGRQSARAACSARAAS